MLTFTNTPLYLCAILIAMMGSAASSRDRVCAEPRDLKQQLEGLHSNQELGSMHDSFHMLPFLREAREQQTKRYRLRKQRREIRAFSGSDNCTNYRLQMGDPCPTNTVINYDPDRYPNIMMEKNCICKGCRGLKSVKRGDNWTISTCEAIYYPVRVLRRALDCKDGVYQYAPVWEKLRIGCKCLERSLVLG